MGLTDRQELAVRDAVPDLPTSVLVLKTAPATEPVSLSDFKTFARIDATDSAQDAFLNLLISAARDLCEKHAGRAFVTQTWVLKLDTLPDTGETVYPRVPIPYPPLVSVSEVRTLALDGTPTVVAASSYSVIPSTGGRGSVAFITVPTFQRSFSGLEIEFVAGYGAASAVPPAIRYAIMLLALMMYENRVLDATIPVQVLNVLRLYEVKDL